MLPRVTASEDELEVTVTGTAPVPVKAIAWVAVTALVEIVSVPVLVPAAAGVKVTATVQLAPAGRLLPHPLVRLKSPEATMDVIVRGPTAVLVRLTVCAVDVVETA